MKKLSKKYLIIGLALLVTLSFSLAGCGSSTSSTQKQSDSGKKEPLQIGLAGPFTGPNADYGKGVLQGAEIAAAEWNAKGGLLGKEIKLEQGDTQGDSKQATTVANKFVSQGIVAVIGPTFSNEGLAANPIFEQAKLPAVSGVCSAKRVKDSPGSSYFFRTIPNDETIAKFAAKYIKEGLNAKTVAYLNDGTSFTKGAVAAIKKEAEALGVQTVFDEGITPGEKDYTATITKLKKLAPDLVVGGTYSPEGGLIKKQASEAKLNAKMLYIMGNQNPTFAEVAGKDNAKGALIVDYPTALDMPTAAGFAAKVQEKYKEKPDTYAAYWYDAANALFRAIEAAGTTDGPKIREALLNLKTFDGASGPVTFAANGERKEANFIVKQYNGSEWTKYNP